jgi:hypothetical protein
MYSGTRAGPAVRGSTAAGLIPGVTPSLPHGTDLDEILGKYMKKQNLYKTRFTEILRRLVVIKKYLL